MTAEINSKRKIVCNIINGVFMAEKNIIELDDAHWEGQVEKSKLPVAIMF